MDKNIITENLDFHDMEGQIEPTVTVDEYESKIGPDHEIVTLSFTVKSELVGKDLESWFERGYNFVLDAQISDGEVDTNKYLVFVEINRRSNVPAHIIELLSDLKTLTNLKLNDWTIKIDDEEYEPDEQILQQVIICNPNKYKMEKNKELNEMRGLAGINLKSYVHKDKELKDYISKAGL